MHEMGIALEVLRVCRDVVAENGGGRIERVCLAVGELTAVEPELIQFAWQAAVAESRDESSVLEIQWCPADQFCPACGEAKQRSEGAWLRLCPDCAMPLDVRGGDELDVLQLTFDKDGENDEQAGGDSQEEGAGGQ